MSCPLILIVSAMEAFTKYLGHGILVSHPSVARGLLLRQLLHQTRLTVSSCMMVWLCVCAAKAASSPVASWLRAGCAAAAAGLLAVAWFSARSG
eukprot:3676798-Amphidinium_carterae.1